jgi:hypothetical protein
LIKIPLKEPFVEVALIALLIPHATSRKRKWGYWELSGLKEGRKLNLGMSLPMP